MKPLGTARDVLVFFSGEREIFDAARQLRKHFVDRFEILPLYARLRLISGASSPRPLLEGGSYWPQML